MNPDDINKQIQDINKSVRSLNKERGTNLSGLGTIPETVTSRQLEAPALDIPTQVPSTAIQGELANLESQTDSFTQNLQQQATQSQQQEQTSFSDLLRQFAESPTEGQLEDRAFGQKGGVDDINKELVDINNQIRNEQQALRRRVESIQDNKQGLFGGAVQDEVNRVERESLRKQADLAVIQQSIQGRYDSAKTIADRAIKAEMEFEKRKLDLAQLAYERNKSLFDKSEQRLFETQQADRERKLRQEETKQKTLQDTKLQIMANASAQGASPSLLSSIQQATTPEEVIARAGLYAGDRIGFLKKQAEYSSMVEALNNPSAIDSATREKIGKFEPTQKAVAKIGLVQNLNQLKQLVKEHGTVNILDPEAKGKIDSLRSQLEIDIAVAGGQGAISEQEADRYQNIIGKDFRFQDKVIGGIDQAIKTQNGKIKSDIDLVRATFGDKAVNFEPFQTYYASEEINNYLDSQVADVEQTEPKTPYQSIQLWLKSNQPKF